MIEQAGIFIFGCTAIWLSQDARAERRKWACIFGLLAQPFWYYSAYTASQWGIFFVCMPYTAAWLKGFYNNWIRVGHAGK